MDEESLRKNCHVGRDHASDCKYYDAPTASASMELLQQTNSYQFRRDRQREAVFSPLLSSFVMLRLYACVGLVKKETVKQHQVRL